MGKVRRQVLGLAVLASCCRAVPLHADVTGGEHGATLDSATGSLYSIPDNASRRSALASGETDAIDGGETFKIGAEYYKGRSNLVGDHRYSDGMWAGYGNFYPSEGYVGWSDGKGAKAKLAVGLGGLFIHEGSEFNQPAEAWYQQPVGKLKVTVGKYWVPFGLQEWEVEPKPGVMLQWGQGATQLAGSVNYNHVLGRANTYFRAGHRFNPHVTLGLSLGGGEGMTYGSPHNRGAGFDSDITWRGFHFNSEWLEFRQNSSGRFHSTWEKLSYEKWHRLSPFVSRYRWLDKTGSQGSFSSDVIGLDYALTPNLAIETGHAKTASQRVSWVQLHWLWEHSYKIKDHAAQPILAATLRPTP